MLKALIKKQLLELFARLFVSPNKRKGKKPRKSKIAGSKKAGIILFCFLFLIIFASIYFWGLGMLDALIPVNADIIYFASFALICIIFGIIMNAFIANTTLFEANDNEVLLSMPIKPSTILVSRMTILLLNCALVCFIMWIPPLVAYFVNVEFSGYLLLVGILNSINITLFVLSVSCIFGWLLSFLSRYSKLKKIVTILIWVIFLLIAMGASTAIKFAMQSIIANPDSYVEIFQQYFGPFFAVGVSFLGDVKSLLLLTVFSFGLFAVVCGVISKTYIKLLTSSRHAKKKKYVAKRVKQSAASSALLKKEFKLFSNYSIYLVNSSLGILFGALAAVAVIVFKDTILAFVPVAYSFGFSSDILIVAITAIMLCFSIANCISTPAISMEGKNVWILKSLPVKSYDVLRSKVGVHFIVNAIGFSVCALVAEIALFGFSLLTIESIALICVFVYVTGQFGIVIGTKRANLTWTNPAVPVKQNLALLFAMLFNLGLFIVLFVLFFALKSLVATEVIMSICIGLLLVMSIIFEKIIKSVSVKHFELL